jgi:exopolysaccharide biosynthesis predicted pyruvyltransferase EpsI
LGSFYDFRKYVKQKYDIGIICHYMDEQKVREKYGDDPNHIVISMRTTDIQKLAYTICQCKLTVSSSLHGIVFSHSLGVPCYHISLSELNNKSGDIKFNDYYSSFPLEYEKFVYRDYKIDFPRILEYDSHNRGKSNPTIDMVKKK